jgi:hypothetical protein
MLVFDVELLLSSGRSAELHNALGFVRKQLNINGFARLAQW